MVDRMKVEQMQLTKKEECRSMWYMADDMQQQRETQNVMRTAPAAVAQESCKRLSGSNWQQGGWQNN